MRSRRRVKKSPQRAVVIRNTGSYDDLWKQVTEAWKQVSPVTDTDAHHPQGTDR